MRMQRRYNVTANIGWDMGCHNPLTHAHVFEPVRPAVFLVKEVLPIGEGTRHASFAFIRLGAVEVGNMLVANVAEPAARLVSIPGT